MFPSVTQTYYYPYGEPTIEPEGQRYLFGGKEREHSGGRNSYDFGARSLTPYGNWSTTDQLAEKFYQLSLYSYCGGDPINYVDKDGKLTIFINGFHTGDGGSSKYWSGIDKLIMTGLNDNKALYFDGSVGGCHNLAYNLEAQYRKSVGRIEGYKNAARIINNLEDGENIKIITHSMGAAYSKGFVNGLDGYAKKNNINIIDRIDFELDLAPFQPKQQEARSDVKTTAIFHYCDGFAPPGKISGAENKVTHKDVFPTLITPVTQHSITSFFEDIKNFIKEYLNGIDR